MLDARLSDAAPPTHRQTGTMMIEKLNDEFALGERLRFESGPGELPCVRFETRQSAGEVSLHRAQVLRWAPVGGMPIFSKRHTT